MTNQKPEQLSPRYEVAGTGEFLIELSWLAEALALPFDAQIIAIDQVDINHVKIFVRHPDIRTQTLSPVFRKDAAGTEFVSWDDEGTTETGTPCLILPSSTASN